MTPKMARPQEKSHNDPVNAAIERVLKTERDGVAALERSANEARCLVEEARTQAGDISRRTDTLISKLHTAYLQKVQRDLQRLAEANPAGGDNPDNDYKLAALAEAVRRAAVKLTGGS